MNASDFLALNVPRRLDSEQAKTGLKHLSEECAEPEPRIAHGLLALENRRILVEARI